MDVRQVNDLLLRGITDQPGLFPHLEELARSPVVFRFDFGLKELPPEPGLLVIRGPRQYGKSTWLEQQLKESVERFGPGSAFYVNGDWMTDADRLTAEIGALCRLFSPRASLRRIFVDEITAVAGWEKALKRLLDSGELRQVLLVTTGSRATDLRRGTERLPGRRGRLGRTQYLFTPVPFAEFKRVLGERIGKHATLAYLLTGGCPMAAAALAKEGKMPFYVTEIVRDWVLGECAASGRQRASLLSVLAVIGRLGGAPVGQAKLAREAGLANNTVAAGYLELLADLMLVGQAGAWDAPRKVVLARRPARYHFINLLAAVTFDPGRPRSVEAIESMPGETLGRYWEWLVAGELWRRAAVRGEEAPDSLPFWQGGGHELDFVCAPELFIEVKLGRASALEFGWFPRQFPRAELVVVGADEFRAGPVRGITMERFLLGEDQAG